MSLSTEIEFLEWLQNNEVRSGNLYKMPLPIFKNLVNKYIDETNKKDNIKIYDQLIKSFKSSNHFSLLDKLSEILPKSKISNIKNLNYLYDRYSNKNIRFKCFFLPLDINNEFETFINQYWKHLDSLSGDYLDIYYSIDDFSNSGFEILNNLNSLKIPYTMLPCIILWTEKLEDAKIIETENLSYHEIFRLMIQIVENIKKHLLLGDVYREAITMINNKTIENIENKSPIHRDRKGESSNKTVLVVTALEKELKPVIDMFQFPLTLDREDVNGIPHYILEVHGIRVIFTTMTKMGQLYSALSIKNTLSHFEVDSVILCGICAGLSKEVNFGDLIISEQIVDYEIAKIDSHGSNIRWNVYRSDYLLMTEMRNFDSNNWKKYVLNNFKERISSPPTIHCGTVLSGNKIIANETEAGKLASIWHNARGLEMEAAGIAAALYMTPNPPSFIMVKSVCDYADSNKNDDWQEYAAQTAAAFVVDFVFTTLKGNKGLKIERNKERYDPKQENLNKLKFAIEDCYNIDEIKDLVFHLGIKYENIAGDTISVKTIELIQYCDRRKWLTKLTNQINKDRDNLLGEIIWSNE